MFRTKTRDKILLFSLLLCLFSGFACTQSSKRVLVTPFENLSAKPEDNWLRDGMSESLNDHLDSTKNVKVITREEFNKVCEDLKLPQHLPFIDEKVAVRVANSLDADRLIIGSFRRRGKNMVVFSRLIDVHKDQIIHNYRNRNIKPANYRFFNQVQEIALHMLPGLGFSKSKADRTKDLMQIVGKRTRSLKAFEYYVLARLASFKNQEANMRVSTNWYRQAIKKDYRYGLAYVGLADALSKWGYIRKQKGISYQEYYRKAHENLRLASKYDRKLSQFHTSTTQDRLDADIHYVLGATYLKNKQYEQSIAAFRQSLAITNEDAMTIYKIGEAYLGLGQIDRARAHYASALEKNPSLLPAMDRLEELLVR